MRTGWKGEEPGLWGKGCENWDERDRKVRRVYICTGDWISEREAGSCSWTFVIKSLFNYIIFCHITQWCYVLSLSTRVQWRSTCSLSCSAATSQARLVWRRSAGWTAWPAAFPACSALWRSTTSCSSCTLTTCRKTTPTRFGHVVFLQCDLLYSRILFWFCVYKNI